MKNKFLLAAGGISFFTAGLHLIGGQLTLVDPLLASNLIPQEKTEWLGAWHIVTILLFFFGYILLKNGLKPNIEDRSLIKWIGILCLLFSFAFIGASLGQQQHAPQYILFLPVAALVYFGNRFKMEN